MSKRKSNFRPGSRYRDLPEGQRGDKIIVILEGGYEALKDHLGSELDLEALAENLSNAGKQLRSAREWAREEEASELKRKEEWFWKMTELAEAMKRVLDRGKELFE